MNIRDSRAIKAAAREALQTSPTDYRKLVFLHMLVAVGASLGVTLLNLLLNQGIDGTGGLSGIGVRSLLTSAQSFLMVAVMLVLPFWEMGLLWTSLRVSRGQEARFSMLTRGFVRIGPAVRLILLRAVLLILVIMLCSNVAGILAMFIPISPEALEALVEVEQTLLTDPAATIDPAQMALFWEPRFPALWCRCS